MTVIPNLIAPEEVACLAREHFGVSFLEDSIEPVATVSGLSDVYFARSEERAFVFKGSRLAEDREVFETVSRVSEELRTAGAPVPRLFRMGDDPRGGFHPRHGEAVLSLMEQVAGEGYASDESRARGFGAALGRLHRASVSVAVPREEIIAATAKRRDLLYEETRGRYESEIRPAVLADHACTFPEVCTLVRREVEAIDRAFAAVEASRVWEVGTLRTGILHGDPNVANVIFPTSDGEPMLIDLDQLVWGPFVHDLGAALVSLAWRLVSEKSEGKVPVLSRAFLAGYHGENPLSADEYALIPAAVLRADLTRVLRALYRHRFEGDRFPHLIAKVRSRMVERLRIMPSLFTKIALPEDANKRIIS